MATTMTPQLVSREDNSAENLVTYEQAFNRLVRSGWPPDLAAYALDDYDAWAKRHNTDAWNWRNQADGFYE
jgi:hypothetical protein